MTLLYTVEESPKITFSSISMLRPAYVFIIKIKLKAIKNKAESY